MTIGGGCLCGAVRFQIEAEPVSVRACWCRDCQYRAAGNATVNVVFPSDALTVMGETSDYVSTVASGNVTHRRFCPKCGTPLFSETDVRPHLVIVRAGSLDDPGIARPQATIWTASAPDWALIDPELPAIPGQP